MRRGQIYRVQRPAGDPKRQRCFVVVSRQRLVDSAYSTVVCAPIFTNGDALSTQVAVGPDEGLKHDSWVACDSLTSLQKTELTRFVGALSPSKIDELDEALRVALAVE
jgi:mRNA interferase MazF